MQSKLTKLRAAGTDVVRPLPGSLIDKKMRRNAEWLFSLDPDRLLSNMRKDCEMDTRGAAPYGGWANYYYHYHRSMYNLYLSFKGYDDEIAETAKKRAVYMTESLLECQKRTAEICVPGFVQPEMEKVFENRMKLVRDSVYSHTDIKAIMYEVHKLTLNLVMMYRIFGMRDALDGAALIARRVYELMSPFTQEERERMTDSRRASDFFSEAGGIMDAFLQLYVETGDPQHLTVANFFRRSWFDNMFLRGDDDLAYGMEHANSEMPYVESLVAQYTINGDEDALKAARGFMRAAREGHELPQGSLGGRSAFPDYRSELFNYPKRVYFHIMDTKLRKDVTSGESCCAHNLNRVAKRLIEVEPECDIMDSWDRRYVNAVLAQQNPDTGMFIYDLCLKNNSYKMWGYPYKSFWCCYGTGAETHAALTEGAFFESDSAVYACLYMPCTYTHAATGISITEHTNYPDDGNIEFEFHGEGELSIFLRLPDWLRRNAEITMPDGETVSTDKKGLYEVKRTWRDGDVLKLQLPFDLWYESMPDRQEYISLKYGPNLLVTCAQGEQFFNGSADELLNALESTGTPCVFVAGLQSEIGSGAHIIKPIRMVKDETFAGYVRVSKPSAETVYDVLKLGDEADLKAHNFHGTGLKMGVEHGHAWLKTSLTFFSEKGEAIFEMKSDPEKELQLRLMLDGTARMYVHQYSGHVVNTLFDLQVKHDGEWKTFSTKSMEGDFPDEIYYENFVIPQKWTKGKEKLELRLIARNFHDIPGVIDSVLDDITLFSVEKTGGTRLMDKELELKDNKVYVPNAQGL